MDRINLNDIKHSGTPIIELPNGRFISGEKRCNEFQKHMLSRKGRFNYVTDTEIRRNGRTYKAYNYEFRTELFVPTLRQKLRRLKHGTQIRKITPPPLPKEYQR